MADAFSSRLGPGGGPASVPSWRTIGDLVEQQARLHPDKLATYFFEGEIGYTYAELRTRVAAVAAGLAAHGVSKGDRVATILYNTEEQVLTWLACSMLGALFTALNVALEAGDLEHALQETLPTVVVAAPERVAQYTVAAKRAGRDGVTAFVTASRAQGALRPFGELLAHGDRPSEVVVHPDDAACLVLTGGTTGLPKAVIRSHYSYMCTAARYATVFEPEPTDRHISNSVLFHSAGQEVGFLGPFAAGIPSYWTKRFSASRFWDLARRSGATLSEMTGAAMTFLLRQPPDSADADNRIRAILCAAHGVAPASREEFAQRFDVEHLLDLYAMSEVGTVLFSNTVSDARPESVGHSRGWCEVVIADDHDRALPAGEVGQILLRPTVPFSMTSGYFRRTDATIAFMRNCWLHTGDMGRLDADGWLYFVERRSDRIRRRGENISAKEVETALGSHAAVAECAVVGVPADEGDEEVKAVVHLREGAAASPEELLHWCGDQLAAFKLPRYIYVSPDPLPRSATKGEIERHMVKGLGGDALWDREATLTELTRART